MGKNKPVWPVRGLAGFRTTSRDCRGRWSKSGRACAVAGGTAPKRRRRRSRTRGYTLARPAGPGPRESHCNQHGGMDHD